MSHPLSSTTKPKRSIRIATRESPLALRQTTVIQQALQNLHPEYSYELVPMTTSGDQMQRSSLATVGGKGLFLKELEEALLESRADIAVHSMKDVPTELPTGLVIGAIFQRDIVNDAFLSNHYSSLEQLPIGAKVGTASLRRQAQCRAIRPDLNLMVLRGNINTRIKKLDEGNYDAIILAAAGLFRMNMQHRITQLLPLEHFIPAVAQAAMCVECRENDSEMLAVLQSIHHLETAICVSAERSFNRALHGGCQVPIAGYAHLNEHKQLFLQGSVSRVDGTLTLLDHIQGPPEQAESLGQQLALALNQQGAQQILAEIYDKKSE